jgi:polar amino acid transport system substrate-binding protein
MTMEKKQIIAIAAVVVVIVAAVGIALAMNNNGGNSGKKINSVDDLSGATIGVVKGYTGETFVLLDKEDEVLSKDTKVNAYTTGAVAIDALKQGYVDCVIIDEQPAKKFVEKNSGLKILDTKYIEESYAFAVKKGNTDLLGLINGALDALKEDGTLAKIEAYYYEGTGEKYQRADEDYSNGTLNMITNAYFPPYESFEDGGDSGNIVGLDVDVMEAVCSKLKMKLSYESMEFGSLIGVLEGSKNTDNYVIGAGMTVTEERKASVDFTSSYTKSVQVIITKA